MYLHFDCCSYLHGRRYVDDVVVAVPWDNGNDISVDSHHSVPPRIVRFLPSCHVDNDPLRQWVNKVMPCCCCHGRFQRMSHVT